MLCGRQVGWGQLAAGPQTYIGEAQCQPYSLYTHVRDTTALVYVHRTDQGLTMRSCTCVTVIMLNTSIKIIYKLPRCFYDLLCLHHSHARGMGSWDAATGPTSSRGAESCQCRCNPETSSCDLDGLCRYAVGEPLSGLPAPLSLHDGQAAETTLEECI